MKEGSGEKTICGCLKGESEPGAFGGPTESRRTAGGEVAGDRGQGTGDRPLQGLECQAAEWRPYPEGTGEPEQAIDKSSFAFKRSLWLPCG